MNFNFIQKFKMATKNEWENDFWEKSQVESVDTVRVKNFIKIILSRTV